jgi:hypothetical protein
MSDSEIAKVQLREHLASVLIPPISSGFWSVHKTALELCERNKQPTEVLRTFQNMITKIPEWSETILQDEVNRIVKISKCSYLDDLLMGVFLAYMKSFAALQYRGASSQIKVEFDRPNSSKFIHELYKQSARKLWQSAYLFKTNIPSEQQSKNRKDIDDLIYKSIDDVVRASLPWESITKAYFIQPVEEEVVPPQSSKSVVFEEESDSDSDDSDEEEVIKQPNIKLGEDLEDNISVTDLEEKPEPVAEPEIKQVVIDPIAEIESNISDSLVLNV